MGYPEITLLSIYAIQGLWVLRYHNVSHKINFWMHLPVSLVLLGCLILGGFFASWGIPQSIYALLFVLSYGNGFLSRHEEKSLNFYGWAIMAALLLSLFAWGGFFT